MGNYLPFGSNNDKELSDTTITIYDKGIIRDVNDHNIHKTVYNEDFSLLTGQKSNNKISLTDINSQKWYIDLKNPHITIHLAPNSETSYNVRLRYNNNDSNLSLFVTPYKKLFKIVNKTSDIFTFYQKINFYKNKKSYLSFGSFNQMDSENLQMFTNMGKNIDILRIYENHYYNIDEYVIDNYLFSYDKGLDLFIIDHIKPIV